MIDKAEILLKAGDGGNGCLSFRREKHVPRGGPDGGDGGRGGSILLVANASVATLIDQHYSQHYTAKHGQHASGKNQHGADAADVRVFVPVGTTVRDAETGELLADLSEDGTEFPAAKGGIGGRGNARFKTATYRAPRVAEKGEPGEERRLSLEVKVIADVGMVGFPNVGKSTLLSCLSDAKPKIADYPFTTLSPNLGVVRLTPGQNFVLADLPGLVEGAHQGTGLGHDFLRHVERTRLLLHVLDAAAVEGRDPIEDYKVINRELRLHSRALGRLPQIIVLTKMDLPEAQARLPELLEAFKGKPVYPVSGATQEGLRDLTRAIYERLRVLRREDAQKPRPAPSEVVYQTRRPYRIHKSGGEFTVEGDGVRRAVVMTDFGNDEAVWLLHSRLKRMGLFKALTKAGAKDGMTVRIGDMELVFSSEESPLRFEDYLASRRQKARRQSRDELADGGNTGVT